MRDLLYPLLRVIEPHLLRRLRLTNRFPPIFIVGGERSGTTLVTLHLAGRFRFAWIPVVAKRRPRHPWAATWRALGRGEWSPNVDNSYGVGSGDLAPSDGWDTIRRWFEEDGTSPRPKDPSLAEFVTLVRLLERLFEAPFLNKNNANSLRIDALAHAFPQARFVYVRRDRVAAVASLMEARRRHGVETGEWWGAVPPAFTKMKFETELEQSVATLVGVELAIEASLAKLDSSRWLELSYEAFCADPNLLTNWVERSYSSADIVLRPQAGELAETRYEASRPQEARRLELQGPIEHAEETLRTSLGLPQPGGRPSVISEP